MPLCDLYSASVSFFNQSFTQNPRQCIQNWARSYNQVVINNPRADSYQLPPGTSLLVFSGTRALSIDDTTEFSVTLNPNFSSIYRFAWVGGTDPVLRSDRGLTLTGEPVTISVNNNATATFTVVGADTFSGVSVGDNLWIPGVTTGDASLNLFSLLNQGLWVIIGKVSSTQITCIRPPGVSFSAANETQTLSSNSQVVAFSNGPVQIGDTVQISAGFSSVTWGSYFISNVTSTFFEVNSSNPIPLESDIIPDAASSTGLVIYSSAKRFVRVEVDQNSILQYNGDVSAFNVVTPLSPGNPSLVGYSEKLGLAYSLTVVNSSSINTLNLKVFSFE